MTTPWPVLWTLAWRNLWRNHRRTLIMLAAIAIGVWAMIFLTAIMRGMVDDMVRGGIGTLPGHVQVHHPAYRDDPSVANRMPPPDPTLAAALAAPEVVAWSGRVKVPAIISSERDSRGVSLIGIDPVADDRLSGIAAMIVEGRFLEGPADRGVLIGARLAERLETRLGKRVVVMSQDPDNDIADRGFRIVGIFRARLQGVEESLVYAGLETVQRMLRIDEELTEVAVLGDDYRDVDALSRDIAAAAGAQRETLPWYELDGYLGSMLRVMDGFVLVWIVIVFVALSFGLVNTLAMAVFERVREIGLMQALGMRPAAIVWQILLESLCLLGLGLLLGDLLAVLSLWAMQGGVDVSAVAAGMEMAGYGSMLYPSLQWRDLLTANVVVIVLGLLTSLLPAWRASRYAPIEALAKT